MIQSVRIEMLPLMVPRLKVKLLALDFFLDTSLLFQFLFTKWSSNAYIGIDDILDTCLFVRPFFKSS